MRTGPRFPRCRYIPSPRSDDIALMSARLIQEVSRLFQAISLDRVTAINAAQFAAASFLHEHKPQCFMAHREGINEGLRSRDRRQLEFRQLPSIRTAAPGVTASTTRCACRKLNPGILVMQSAQDWATNNVPGAIDGARDRCIFLQGEMRAAPIVIFHVRQQEVTEVARAEHNNVV